MKISILSVVFGVVACLTTLRLGYREATSFGKAKSLCTARSCAAPTNHSCSTSMWSQLVELIPAVKEVRHFQAPYLDFDTGKVVVECPPWADVWFHVLHFKLIMPLLGDGWLFQKDLLRMNMPYLSWDKTFKEMGQDPLKEVKDFCDTWGVKLDPYMWSKPMANYTTPNDFFTRKYSVKYKPENNLGNSTIVQPADSIVTWYDSAALLPSLLKNEDWTLASIGIPNHTAYLPFPAIIAYLAPYDYHCYHAPISGRLIKADLLNQEQWSLTVKSYIYSSANILRRNRRAVVILQSDAHPSLSVAMVIVGGVTVDSIRLEQDIRAGVMVRKGQLLGCFARGGSTVALLFNDEVKPASQPKIAIRQGLTSFRRLAGQNLAEINSVAELGIPQASIEVTI